MATIAVCIPVHSPNLTNGVLLDALASVLAQTRRADQIHVAVDWQRRGAWHTRQRALDAATADWVAFLDSDDLLHPTYLERMLAAQEVTGADYLYAWFDGGPDPLGHFGKPFDPTAPTHTTMTVVVRRELAQAVGFTPPRPEQVAGGEDWRFLLGCMHRNAVVRHVPERLWHWRRWPGNTSGQPSRWA